MVTTYQEPKTECSKTSINLYPQQETGKEKDKEKDPYVNIDLFLQRWLKRT